MDFSPIQLIIVLVIVLVVFGAKRLPELGRNLGAGAREFKDGITGQHDEVHYCVSFVVQAGSAISTSGACCWPP